MGERYLFLMKCHEMQLWGGGLEEVLMGWEGRHVYGNREGRGGGRGLEGGMEGHVWVGGLGGDIKG